jgi:ABC-2 type transport system ATP-binding protein
MHDEKETLTSRIEFEVSAIDAAVELLRQHFAEFEISRISGNKLSILAPREKVPLLNSMFVKNEIDVFQIQTVKATLEDRFLEITNREKKEQNL